MLCAAVSQIKHETVMSIYLTKLAHVLVVLNCPYSDAQMCTREDTLAHHIGAPYFDDFIYLRGNSNPAAVTICCMLL